jgi:hypothetical protein
MKFLVSIQRPGKKLRRLTNLLDQGNGGGGMELLPLK